MAMVSHRVVMGTVMIMLYQQALFTYELELNAFPAIQTLLACTKNCLTLLYLLYTGASVLTPWCNWV